MNIHRVTAGATALAVLLTGSVAFAQVAGSNGVSVVSTPVTTAISPGTNVTFGTITVTSDAQGASITSLPITLAAGGGGLASNLSNCQVFNSSGVAVSSAVNPALGTNAFNFLSPVAVGGSAGTISIFTIRCTLAANTAGGSTFQFIAGSPVLGSALNANLVTPVNVVQGGTSNAIALITLDATHSGNGINVSSIPVLITGNGAAVSQLSGCQIRDISNLSGSLSNAFVVSNGTATSFSLVSPLSIPAGTRMTLVLTCNVDASTPIGGSFTVSLAPSSLGATVQGTGTVVTPTTSIGASGNTLPTAGTVTVALSGTPGLPNTGEGGNPQAIYFALALFALVAAAGAGLVLRRTQA